MARTTVPTQQVRDDNILIQDLADFAVVTASGLNVTVQAGRVRNDNAIVDRIAQTVSLTASSSNYVEIDPSTGTASFNTSAFTTGKIPLALVVTGVSTVTTITDKRTWVMAQGSNNTATTSIARTFLLMGA